MHIYAVVRKITTISKIMRVLTETLKQQNLGWKGFYCKKGKGIGEGTT